MSLRNIAGTFVLFAALGASTAAIAQDATIDQVYQTMHAGRYGEAQAMMDKVLRDHPTSAKAHYVEAEILAKEGNFSGARSELANAERIDPGLSFANPASVQELKSQLSQGSAPARVNPSYAPPAAGYAQPARSGGISMFTILVIVGIIAFIIIVARAMGRRNAVMVPGGYGGAGYGAAPGGYPVGPGYGPGYGPGGGMGSGILGGLATGAAMGAGLVAGEELVHHFTDGNNNNYVPPPSGGGWDNPPANTDMGGNDFGISDAGSWDSGGGGGDMGGGGDGGWS